MDGLASFYDKIKIAPLKMQIMDHCHMKFNDNFFYMIQNMDTLWTWVNIVYKSLELDPCNANLGLHWLHNVFNLIN
jgi:hypothetical protein